MSFVPRDQRAHEAANQGHDVDDYCANCQQEFMQHTNGLCPGEKPASPAKPLSQHDIDVAAEALVDGGYRRPFNTVDAVISTMEGQALYELYARSFDRMREGSTWAVGYDVSAEGVVDYTPLEWKRLSPLRKAFWQELAQDFLKAAS